MASIMDAMRGKFSKRQGATSGRVALTSKRAPRNFYKGKGARSLGHITSQGKFILAKHKVPELVVPDLTGCELKPYVSYKTPKEPPSQKEVE